MKQCVIVEGLRTPFCKAGKELSDLPAYDLGKVVVTELLARTGTGLDGVDEVIVGNIGQPQEAINIARIIALRAGLDESIPAFTVQRNCGSGLQAIVDACYRIQSGDAQTIVAGGTESMSLYPLLFPKSFNAWWKKQQMLRRQPARAMHWTRFKSQFLSPVVTLQLVLRDQYCEMNMGQTAELLTREFSISREEQDELALLSHQRAATATSDGLFDSEIVPVHAEADATSFVQHDSGIRAKQTIADLSALKPVFDREYGSVTAGNSSQITDGAAMVMMMSTTQAKSRKLPVLGRVRSFAFAGLDPSRMGLGPAYASGLALQKAGMTMKDIDLIELNEAFAAVVIANERLFADRKFGEENFGSADVLGEIDREKLNVNGGAIALGHPVGASAARLVVTLLKELERQDLNVGLATMCIGGGQGGAIIVERA